MNAKPFVLALGFYAFCYAMAFVICATISTLTLRQCFILSGIIGGLFACFGMVGALVFYPRK